MKTISLTIPLELNALTRASDMLHGLAIDLGKETAGATIVTPEETQALNEAAPAATTEAENVFAPKSTPTPAPSAAIPHWVVKWQALNEPAAAAAAAAPAAESATNAAPVVTASAPVGVDTAPSSTDANTLVPWDHRIHASSKGKLAKEPNGWKMKRGIDAGLIVQVETELRAAMAAGPANPVVTTDEPAAAAPAAAAAAPAAAAPVEVKYLDSNGTPWTEAELLSFNYTPEQIKALTVAPVAAPAEKPAAAPAEKPAATGAVTTFPALMAAITANAIDQVAVTAAVNAQGLTALPLLAARPDLIPAVAAALGV